MCNLDVLYGHETWSFTLREKHKLRVLRKMLGHIISSTHLSFTQLDCIRYRFHGIYVVEHV
jgi:hypothetical protein